jgi:hypothetical protein
VTPAEIKEILMQMAFYGGMPVALKALRIAQEEITAWTATAPAVNDSGAPGRGTALSGGGSSPAPGAAM